jgi:quercetin dioxygenase-like cupin family protein
MGKAQLFDFAELETEKFERFDITGHQINRHLVSRDLVGISGLVADFIVFPPGFIHHMHRHPHADQFLLPLSGGVEFHGVPGPPIEVAARQLLMIPRETWHEVRNVSDEDCVVFHCFNGVDSIADIGFEPFADATA